MWTLRRATYDFDITVPRCRKERIFPEIGPVHRKDLLCVFVPCTNRKVLSSLLSLCYRPYDAGQTQGRLTFNMTSHSLIEPSPEPATI